MATHLSRPLYSTANSLARRAGVSRSVVLRLASSGLIYPVADVENAGKRVPLFDPMQAPTVLRYASAPTHAGK